MMENEKICRQSAVGLVVEVVVIVVVDDQGVVE